MLFLCGHRRVWTVQYELPLFDARVIKNESNGSLETVDNDDDDDDDDDGDDVVNPLCDPS